MLLLLAPIGTPTRAAQEGAFTFDENGATAVLRRYVGPGGAVIIPDRLGNLPVAIIRATAFQGRTDLTGVTIPNTVSSIEDKVFFGCAGLTNVTIPDSVTFIGQEVFSGCTKLASIAIPNSVTSIGGRAFSGCTGLTSVTIPISLTSIEQSVFSNCTNLTSVTIPNSVTSIRGSAFSGCASLTNIMIPNGVTSIGDSAFSGCTGLTSVMIPRSVISIGNLAFRSCTALKAVEVDSLNSAYLSVDGILFDKAQSMLIVHPATKVGTYTIPDGVTIIGDGAFSGCTGLTSVTIPNSVTSIGVVAFLNCTGLTSVTIPSSVTSIGVSAFNGCTGLTSATLPNGVTSIGGFAFSDCKGLTSVAISSSVASIGVSAFAACTNLRTFEVDSLSLAYSSIDGVLFNKDQSALIRYPEGRAGPYTIPGSVGTIGQRAFSGCTGLTSVTIPDGLASIGERAFSGCTGLIGVAIPDRVFSIEDGAFAGCTSLTRLAIPKSVTSIRQFAFGGCTRLGAIEVDSLNLAYSSSEGVLFNKARTTLLSYPAGKTGPYEIPDSVTSLGWYSFWGCPGLTSITIPNGVKSIGIAAFEGCVGLRSVTIPNTVTSIESSAFEGCTGLTNATISDSVSLIAFEAFKGCTGLTSVVIPKTVTSIQNDVFSGCTGIASVHFEGNFPAGSNFPTGFPLSDSAFVTVFYRSGATGWGPVYGGRPTAVWTPPPAYADWATSTGLSTQFPNASAEDDDPDGDGFPNRAEWAAATDPTQAASRLELEPNPRPADLAPSDQTPIDPAQHPLYFPSIPGKYYAIQSAPTLGAPWQLQATRIASTAQTRILLPKPEPHAFYRVQALP